MKRILILSCAVVLGCLLAGPALFAADYSHMTTEEMASLRGTMQNAPTEERQAFQKEWQRRLQAMSPEERQRYQVQTPWVRGQDEYRLQGKNAGRERQQAAPAEGKGPAAIPFQEQEQQFRAIEPGRPRRFGQEKPQQKLPQVGPRRFSLTPDYDGQSRSPFAEHPSGGRNHR